jgi:hypothetical protein
MFILTGSRTILLTQTVERDIACPMCDSKQIRVTVHQSYHHIFFLPTFPLGKQLEIRCLACTAAQQDCATPELIKKHYPQKTSIKYWTGTLLILIAIAVATFYLKNS